MITLLEGFADNVVAMRAEGTVRASDYDEVLTPAVNAALQRHDKVRIYYEIAGDFSGFTMGAMVDDMKMGLAHLRQWDRVAVVTDLDWLRMATQAFRPFMPCPVQLYRLDERARAKDWISA